MYVTDLDKKNSNYNDKGDDTNGNVEDNDDNRNNNNNNDAMLNSTIDSFCHKLTVTYTNIGTGHFKADNSFVTNFATAKMSFKFV